MALAFLNRCGFRAASSGTGSFVVASALTGMQTPAQAAGPAAVDGATYRYFAQSDDLTQWEYGSGVYTSGDTTLTRATVYDNSSGGTTALSFSAAPQVRMGGPLAQDMHWEVIGDTTVSSPVASVGHTYDPSRFSVVVSEARNVTFDGGTTPNYALQWGENGENEEGSAGPQSTSASDEHGGQVTFYEGANAVIIESKMFVLNDPVSDNFVYDPTAAIVSTETTPSTRTISWIGSENNGSAIIDIATGRFTTYGKLLP